VCLDRRFIQHHVEQGRKDSGILPMCFSTGEIRDSGNSNGMERPTHTESETSCSEESSSAC